MRRYKGEAVNCGGEKNQIYLQIKHVLKEKVMRIRENDEDKEKNPPRPRISKAEKRNGGEGGDELRAPKTRI